MEIFLKRPHPQVPWGFRIIGGSDSHLPIIVSKVLGNSVAEISGLQEDVILERINNVPTCGLSHSEVNQVILAAENELLLTIKRVNLETLILATLSDEETDSEISNILRQIINKDVRVEKENSFQEEKESEEVELKREFETIIDPSRYQTQNRINRPLPVPPPGKKWSTFLQKPQNPTPKDRNQTPPVSKENRYKVTITKQTKKEKPAPQITVDVPEEELEQPELEEEHIPSEVETNYEMQVADDTLIQIEDHEADSIDNQVEDIKEYEETHEITHQENDEIQEENEQKEFEEAEANCEIKYAVRVDAPSLEEQLAAVQKQLQELAQLPSTIQDTLSAVTQQLASIVASKVHENETEDEGTQETEGLEEVTDKEGEEVEVGDIEPSENASEVVEEISESADMEEPQSEVLSDICEEQELSEIIEEEENQQSLAEIQAEEQKLEENIQKKQQDYQKALRDEEENLKTKHSVRPIILPGGRKWVDPDDAVVKVKNPKMSDDKICNTIETFSEVIVGKVKGWTSGIAGGHGPTARNGFLSRFIRNFLISMEYREGSAHNDLINFLKYTPPSKNLEYLQRSDVYRLVHGMEPPVKGISLRTGKIFSEQDYYTPGGN